MKKILPIFLAGVLHASSSSDQFCVYSGVFDVLRERHRTFEFGLEYQFSPNWPSPIDYLVFRPILGIMANTQYSTFMYGGINFDLMLTDHWIITPGFAPGWYQMVHGKNLGFPLEFRTMIEMGWQFDEQTRMGLYFYHISNASLGHHNPGEESIGVFYNIPISSGFLFNKRN